MTSAQSDFDVAAADDVTFQVPPLNTHTARTEVHSHMRSRDLQSLLDMGPTMLESAPVLFGTKYPVEPVHPFVFGFRNRDESCSLPYDSSELRWIFADGREIYFDEKDHDGYHSLFNMRQRKGLERELTAEEMSQILSGENFSEVRRKKTRVGRRETKRSSRNPAFPRREEPMTFTGSRSDVETGGMTQESETSMGMREMVRFQDTKSSTGSRSTVRTEEERVATGSTPAWRSGETSSSTGRSSIVGPEERMISSGTSESRPGHKKGHKSSKKSKKVSDSLCTSM